MTIPRQSYKNASVNSLMYLVGVSSLMFPLWIYFERFHGSVSLAQSVGFALVPVINATNVLFGSISVWVLQKENMRMSYLRTIRLILIFLLVMNLLIVVLLFNFFLKPSTNYLRNYFTNHGSIPPIMDFIQKHQQCCGVEGAKDYKPESLVVFKVPLSCCSTKKSRCEYPTHADVYKKGCFPKNGKYGYLSNAVGDTGFWWVIVPPMLLLIAQTIAVVFFCYTYNYHSNIYTKLKKPCNTPSRPIYPESQSLMRMSNIRTIEAEEVDQTKLTPKNTAPWYSGLSSMFKRQDGSSKKKGRKRGSKSTTSANSDSEDDIGLYAPTLSCMSMFRNKNWSETTLDKLQDDSFTNKDELLSSASPMVISVPPPTFFDQTLTSLSTLKPINTERRLDTVKEEAIEPLSTPPVLYSSELEMQQLALLTDEAEAANYGLVESKVQPETTKHLDYGNPIDILQMTMLRENIVNKVD